MLTLDATRDPHAPEQEETRRAAEPPESPILALQRSAGNQAVARYMATLARDGRQKGGQDSGGGVPAPAPAGGQPAGTDGSGGGSPPPTAAPQGASSPDELPLSGEARIRLNEGMTFPLGGEDLSELSIGQGKLQSEAVPIADSGFEASIEVGAHNPMRLAGQRIDVSPIVVKISAEQIAKRRQEREEQARESGLAKVGAGVGGIVGGLAAATPLGWALGHKETLDAAAIAGGKLGADIAATDIEQTFTAELEEASVHARFPLIYNPYVTLHLGVVKLSRFIDAQLTLQTSWELMLSPFLSLGQQGGTAKGTRIELTFKNGKLSRAAFNLALTGGLDIDLSAMGMLNGKLSILRILTDEERERDPGVVNVELFNTDAFDIIKGAHLGFAGTANLELATGSPVHVAGEKVSATPKAKSCKDKLLELVTSKPVGDKIKKEATSTEKGKQGWHAGTDEDPIPVDWFKPLDVYLHTLKARSPRGKIVTITNWPHDEYRELAEDPEDLGLLDDEIAEHGWSVGISNQYVPRKGRKLKRTTPGSRNEERKWRERAKRFEVDLSGAEVDHVIDLGLGGDDDPKNLWPIKESANQKANDAMYQQRIPTPWLPPGTPGETTVGALPPDTYVLEIRNLLHP